jgi:sterol 3beta-glucosyltransferase
MKASAFGCVVSCGYLAVTAQFIGFWSKSFTKHDTRYRLSVSSVKKVKPVSRKFGLKSGLALEIEGRRDLSFVFKNAQIRDEAVRRIDASIQGVRAEVAEYSASQEGLVSSPTSTITSSSGSSTKVSTPSRSATGVFSPLARTIAVHAEGGLTEAQMLKLPKAINLPSDNLSSFPSKHFVCLTIGSRGDVQPYIALGLALQREGHRVTIVTHEEYGDWVRGFGLNHRIAGGDPGQLMKLSVENKVRCKGVWLPSEDSQDLISL